MLSTGAIVGGSLHQGWLRPHLPEASGCTGATGGSPHCLLELVCPHRLWQPPRQGPECSAVISLPAASNGSGSLQDSVSGSALHQTDGLPRRQLADQPQHYVIISASASSNGGAPAYRKVPLMSREPQEAHGPTLDRLGADSPVQAGAQRYRRSSRFRRTEV